MSLEEDITMKIITAPTPEQHSYLNTLIEEFHSNILPSFFSPTYVEELLNFGVLDVSTSEEYSLQDMLDVTASLQMIKALLECLIDDEADETHPERYYVNRKILEKHYIYFPFTYKDFKESINSQENPEIMLGKADNEWLI